MRMLTAAVMTLALCAAARAQDAAVWDARLGAVKGEVTVYSSGDADGAAGEEGLPLAAGDRVVTGEGASAEVVLDGGSLFTLREGSDFQIEAAQKADSVFTLSAGSLLAKIQKLAEQKLRVRTTAAVAAVRGTEFGVELDGEETHVGVFDEGKVEVSGAAGGPAETLISNQETKVPKGGGPLHAHQLQRFTRHRALMRGHGRRLAAIRKQWKPLPPQQRLELRKRGLERGRGHHREMLERRRRESERRGEKRGARGPRGERPDQKKMREFREKVRRQRGERR